MMKIKNKFQSKTEMLDNLLEIEVAYSLLKGGDAGEDPIDAHYKKLHTEMEVCIKAPADWWTNSIVFILNFRRKAYMMHFLFEAIYFLLR